MRSRGRASSNIAQGAHAIHQGAVDDPSRNVCAARCGGSSRPGLHPPPLDRHRGLARPADRLQHGRRRRRPRLPHRLHPAGQRVQGGAGAARGERPRPGGLHRRRSCSRASAASTIPRSRRRSRSSSPSSRARATSPSRAPTTTRRRSARTAPSRSPSSTSATPATSPSSTEVGDEIDGVRRRRQRCPRASRSSTAATSSPSSSCPRARSTA